MEISAPFRTIQLVYLDNWCRDFVVDHNVCWNAQADAGIRINAPAAGHQIYNNTLFNCDNIGAHTYDAWPNNNPNPAFWTSDFYSWSSQNNLFLAGAPSSQLIDWAHQDFRLQPNAAAINTGVVIPGYTDECVGAPDQGAYEFGGPMWKAGAEGWHQPRLSITNSSPGNVTLTAPPGAAYFQLMMATNSARPLVWVPVLNPPTTSATQWSITLPVPAGAPLIYRLQAK